MKIRLTLIALLLCLLANLPIGHVSARFSSLRQDPAADTLRTSTRRNIGSFYTKLRTKKEVTIAYFGGSATAGAGSSEAAKTSYRTLVTEWLRSRNTQAQIKEINAAVDGTGSLYGAMRARRDVIAHKPDLVFIEFASDDAGEKESTVKRAVEGIVRQFLTVSQPPEIVFLYTTNAKRNTQTDWYESVASYYRLPSLNLQDLTWKMIESGQTTPSAFWKDGLHLLDAGSKIYARLIIDYLTEQEKLTPSPITRSLPPPFLSDELTYGELIPCAQLKHDAMWKVEPSNDRSLPATMLAGDKPGTIVETLFEGTIVGLVYRAGPDAGTIECLIDGRPAPAPLDRIDAYDSVHHLATRIIAGGLGPGEHKLTIKIHSEKNPKSNGTNFRLGYLIIGGARPERL
jgi:lysophospholipase L1-like esterase